MTHVVPAPDIHPLRPSAGPFQLVDRVLEVVAGVAIVALKNVSLNEPYFAGHFPGRPVMPGVLLCESLAQAGALLARQSGAAAGTEPALVLVGLDAVRFRRAIVPGEQVRLEVALRARHGGRWKMHGRAIVDGEVAAEADLLFREV